MGDLKGALKSLETAQELTSNLLDDHENTARTHCEVGRVQFEMGHLKAALDSLQKAVNMRSKLLADHEDTASSCHMLGLVLRDMEDI